MEWPLAACLVYVLRSNSTNRIFCAPSAFATGISTRRTPSFQGLLCVSFKSIAFRGHCTVSEVMDMFRCTTASSTNLWFHLLRQLREDGTPSRLALQRSVASLATGPWNETSPAMEPATPSLHDTPFWCVLGGPSSSYSRRITTTSRERQRRCIALRDHVHEQWLPVRPGYISLHKPECTVHQY